jgi:hypothetical protein
MGIFETEINLAIMFTDIEVVLCCYWAVEDVTYTEEVCCIT